MKKVLFAAIGLIAVGAAVALFFVFRPTPAPGQGKVGVVPAAYYLPVFVAREKGFFAEEGLDVEVVVFNSNSDMFTAFLKGDLDATGLGSAGAFPFEATEPGRIKFIYGQNNKSYSLVVAKDSAIDSLKGLKGKRVGTWPSPTSKTFLKLLFDKQGIKDGDYEIVPLEFKSLNRALQRNEVDAVFNTDLFTEAGIRAGISRYLIRQPLPELLIDPTFNGGGMLRTKMIEKDPDRAERYIRAFRKAIDFINNDERSARLVMLKYLPFEEEVVLHAPMDQFVTAEQINVPKAQELADMLAAAGLVKGKIDVGSMIYRGAK